MKAGLWIRSIASTSSPNLKTKSGWRVQVRSGVVRDVFKTTLALLVVELERKVCDYDALTQSSEPKSPGDHYNSNRLTNCPKQSNMSLFFQNVLQHSVKKKNI